MFCPGGISLVMAGLVPAIHALLPHDDVDARDKPAHDGVQMSGISCRTALCAMRSIRDRRE
jgi:hypothetical protein